MEDHANEPRGMALSVKEGDPLRYDVPLFQYMTSLEVVVDREGYKTVREAIKKNVTRALVLLDQASAERFLIDWVSLVGIFSRAGVLDAEKTNNELRSAREFKTVALNEAVKTYANGFNSTLNGIQEFLNGKSFWEKAILAAAAAGVGYAAFKRGRKTGLIR